jgi:Cd2+/Zn2+-exporting ATPase
VVIIVDNFIAPNDLEERKRKMLLEDDSCACCDHDHDNTGSDHKGKILDHDHGHGHDHHLSEKEERKRKMLMEEDSCDCCDHDHGHTTHAESSKSTIEFSHDHGHEHHFSEKEEIKRKMLMEEDSCECCDHDHGSTSHALEPSTASFQHNHEHGHGHDHIHSQSCCKDDKASKKLQMLAEEESCDCCDHSNPVHETFQHDHGHGHEHHKTKECCSSSSCSHHSKSRKNNCVGDDECDCCDHNTTAGSNAATPTATTTVVTTAAISAKVTVSQSVGDIELGTTSGHHSTELNAVTASSKKCNFCDPQSPLEHTIQTTKFRVANLCCAGEEKLIHSTLEKMVGIDHVAVNIIGRYAMIKHCTMDCCSPSEKIMESLNQVHLGVSIQDINNADENGHEKLSWSEFGHRLYVMLVAVLFLIGLVLYLIPEHHYDSEWLFITSIILGIIPILYASGIALLLRHNIDINILIAVAVAGALASKEYFDGSLVVALFLLSEMIEHIVMEQVQRLVSVSAGSIIPKQAYLATGQTIEVMALKIGDVIAVRAGEMIACDGIITKGEGVVDESSLTGESIPLQKKKGDTVLSGTVVQNGYLEIEINKDPQQSTLKQLQQAVEDVQADKGQFAKLVDAFALYWTPLIIVATLFLVLVGGGVTGEWWDYLHRGLVLLVLACPCAIVISAPIPTVCTIASAAKAGVLIRGSSAIEKLCLVDTVAVDKTGTLTKGYFKVTENLLLQDPAEAAEVDVRLLVAALEQKSTHPLANAVVSDYCGCIAEMAESSMKFPAVRKVVVKDGVGLEGWVEVEDDWKHLAVGNERLLRAHGGKVKPSTVIQKKVDDFVNRHAAQVILYVALDDELVLLISLADEVRPEAPSFIHSLQQQRGLDVVMLTGDHKDIATLVCQDLGIAHCHARLLPHDKLAKIKSMQDEDHKYLMMIGDGINDSTALACATIGVAMGVGGTAMAITAADVVLMNDNLALIPKSLAYAHYAKQVILENVIFAVVIKIVAIVLAIMGLLEFWEAVIIDIGSLLVVVANGLKVLYLHPSEASKSWLSILASRHIAEVNHDSLKGKDEVREGCENILLKDFDLVL